MSEEISTKLGFIRQTLSQTEAGGVRLRGTDWFAWVTGGDSNTVLLMAETGVAEGLITGQDAWILTDEIEAQRLKDEELPRNFKLHINPWADHLAREATDGEMVLSDKPTPQEQPIPPSLQQYKRVLLPTELERYRQVGENV